MRYFRSIGSLDVRDVVERVKQLRMDQPHDDDLVVPGLQHKAVIARMHHDATIPSYLEDHPVHDRPLLTGWGALQDLLASAQRIIAGDPVVGSLVDHTKLGRVVFSIIYPQSYVQWHIDPGDYVATTRRFHIPMITTLKAANFAPDEIVHMPVGQLTWVDNRLPHSAVNWSDTARNHLIFELYERA